MKKIILYFVFFWSLQTLSAQELKWQTDINKAIELSTKSKKPLMLFFTGSDWCGWCIKLQKEVFQKPEFVEWSKKVILVELDFPKKTQLEASLKQQNDQLQQIFQVQGFPTIWFVSPQKNGTQINLQQLGKTGYVAGGPEKWLEAVNQFMPK
ncbi:MAG TPA: thioredoxin family protein [Flavobacterium sp.]|jgi:protein disulfide-isomerase|nr:thioredoxin family protein [Flavobacterium sp.]HRZ30820.1 thioredoxin family protein [Flavobacterium sp.]